MKRTWLLILVSIFLILVFASVLVGSVFAVSDTGMGRGDNIAMSVPNVTAAIDKPLTKRQLEMKYEKYNALTSENGKTAVTVFSEAQIDEFHTRRNDGEWFWISTEEMLYLIEDTVRLLEENDLVYVWDLDGVLHKYYGLSFYASDAYFASFGGLDLGVADASFDMKQDIYEIVYARITVLNSACIKTTFSSAIVLTDIQRKPTEYERERLCAQNNPWCWYSDVLLANAITQFGAWEFNQERILYQKITASIDYINPIQDLNDVFSDEILPDGVSPIKYDNAQQNVVIELYDTDTEELVARVRLTEEETKTTEALIREFSVNYGSPGNATQDAEYRALIYCNGMDFWFFTKNGGVLYYCPDGDPTLCSVYGSQGNSLNYPHFHFSGFDTAAEYLSGILKERLQ